MKRHPHLPLAWALLAVAAAPAVVLAQASPSAAPGLQAVQALARLNGQALACQDTAAMRRAKTLMLAHAPKTARYGVAYDEATQQSYLEATRSKATCPDAATLAAQLGAVAERLQAELPASGVRP
jgi:hypothetical protein